jgi:hypothetical protein
MVNVKSLAFKDLVCPFDVAVQVVEELRLENCVRCLSSARSPRDVLRLFLSGRARRLHFLPRTTRDPGRKAFQGGVGWYGEKMLEGPGITLHDVLSVAETPEFSPYLEVQSRCCGGRLEGYKDYDLLKRKKPLHYT